MRSVKMVLLAAVLFALVHVAGLPGAQTAGSADAGKPLRVAIAGLVHGHAEGFFSNAVRRKDIEIVGVAEPDRALFDRYDTTSGAHS